MTATQRNIGMTDLEASNNLKIEVKEGVLILRIALDVEGETSKSGKSKVIASTRGNKEISGTDGGKLGLNFYR